MKPTVYPHQHVLRASRHAHGFTQAEVGILMEPSAGTTAVNRLETSHRVPHLHTMLAALEAVGASVLIVGADGSTTRLRAADYPVDSRRSPDAPWLPKKGQKGFQTRSDP